MPHVKKTTSEKGKFDSNKKLGLERTMNGLGKPFLKKNDLEIKKKQKKNLLTWTLFNAQFNA